MPLWAVIMALGATFCGWVFLKAREQEKRNTLKKLKMPPRTMEKAVKKAAQRPSGVTVYEAPKSDKEVSASADLPSSIAKELEEILKEDSERR